MDFETINTKNKEMGEIQFGSCWNSLLFIKLSSFFSFIVENHFVVNISEIQQML